jgi:hypothetical protein
MYMRNIDNDVFWHAERTRDFTVRQIAPRNLVQKGTRHLFIITEPTQDEVWFLLGDYRF